MIAHELGHDRNGDVSRGWSSATAVQGLERLSGVTSAGCARATAFGELGLAFLDWGTGILMWLVSRPVDALLWLEAHLLLRDMQRAEYLADALAARVAGTAAAIALQEQMLLTSAFWLAVQQAAQAGDDGDVLARATEALCAVPDRERERRRRAARLEHARLDDTHPPTGMRIAMLEGRPAQAPAVTLNSAWSARIDTELEPLRMQIGARCSTYRSSLYSG